MVLDNKSLATHIMLCAFQKALLLSQKHTSGVFFCFFFRSETQGILKKIKSQQLEESQ